MYVGKTHIHCLKIVENACASLFKAQKAIKLKSTFSIWRTQHQKTFRWLWEDEDEKSTQRRDGEEARRRGERRRERTEADRSGQKWTLDDC